MHYKVYFFLSVLLFAVFSAVSAQNYTVVSFNAQYKLLYEDAKIIDLCREFMTKSDNIDAIREAQNRWKEIDPEKVLAFCQELYNQNPNSAKDAYLLGRVTPEVGKQLELGRKAIQLDPKWPYGYRLLLACYQDDLFNSKGNPARQEVLMKELPTDEHYFTEITGLFPDQTFAWQFLMNYRIYKKDFTAVLQTLAKGDSMKAPWASKMIYANIYARMGRYSDALKTIEAGADEGIAKGQLSADEKAPFVSQLYQQMLTDAGANDEALSYLLSNEGDNPDSGKLYDIACFYSLTGDKEHAIEYLTLVGEKKWDNADHVKQDSDLIPLHGDPRWEKLLAVYQANWNSGKEARKQKMLTEKVDNIAPLWKLTNAAGDSVSLSDFRGKIVILDFWATWCGYCALAMPMVNEFTQKMAGDSVIVIAVDVWEKGRAKVQKFMKEKDYKMYLVYGNDELPKAYDFKGIPYICAIDRNGKIRYIESGYSPGLYEKLVWWTEDLSKQP